MKELYNLKERDKINIWATMLIALYSCLRTIKPQSKYNTTVISNSKLITCKQGERVKFGKCLAEQVLVFNGFPKTRI